MNEGLKQEPRGKELDSATREALDRIEEIMQEIYLVGNNDFELSAIKEIIRKVTNGEFKGQLEDAIRQALRIKNSKMER